MKIPSATDDPNVESLAPFELDPTAVPEPVTRHLATPTAELEALGFRALLHHRIDDHLHHVETHLATFVHESGRAWARIHNRVWSVRTPPKDVLFVEYVTPFTDGTFLWSLSSKPDLAAPPTCTLVRRTGAPPAELWAAHEARLLELSKHRSALAVRTSDELRAASERHHSAVRNFHLRRGVFVPLSDSQRRTAAANAQTRKAVEATGTRYPEVLAAMRRLQERKSSWTTGILVLLVSAGLFVGTGGRSGWTLESLAILVPVLFFHEAGHWVAMRAFGYRNLQMFFIPFLGAAVTGRHYNVPGWKKAVVSLMGPVPGVLAGAVLGGAGLLLHQPLLLKIALMALVLNGFNLLPVLPLDGGWVVQAVLASRSVAFGVLFRVIAVVALFAWGLRSHDQPLTYLGIFMALGLPTAYKLTRITRDLRQAGLEPVSADDQTIPVATAEAIIARIVEAFPKRTPTNQLAQHTLDVFESLNARPPGILASLGLAFAQGASLVAAVVFGVLVVVGQHGSLGGFVSAAQTLPKHRLEPAALSLWRAPDAPESATTPHNVVVATFGSGAAAAMAARELQQRSSARSAVETFGDTLLVALPVEDDAARREWLAALQSKAGDVFVATPKAPASVRLACLASSADAATGIEQDANAYFVGGRMRLLPPWVVADSRTPEERGAHARARRTYARLVRNNTEIFLDPRMRDLAAKTAAARKTADAAAAERLRGEREQLIAELRRARTATLRADPDTDAAVVDRYEALAGAAPQEDGDRRVAAELGPLLGQIALVDGVPDPKTSALAAAGVVSRQGLLVNMPFVRFADTFEGPPAAVRWLQARGCGDFRYEFAAGYEADQNDDEEN